MNFNIIYINKYPQIQNCLKDIKIRFNYLKIFYILLLMGMMTNLEILLNNDYICLLLRKILLFQQKKYCTKILHFFLHNLISR